MFMSDSGIAFSKSIGWTRGADRTGRYAMVIDHGKIVYAEKEPGGDVTVCPDEVQLFLATHTLTLVRYLALKPYFQSFEADKRGDTDE